MNKHRISQLSLLLLSLTLCADASAKNLVAGWNLVGNGPTAPISVASQYGDPLVVTSVWSWDPMLSSWSFYTPSMTPAALLTYAAGKGYGVLSQIQPGDGYWVNAKIATTGTVAPVATAAAPITTTYFDFNYLQNVNGIPSSTASIIDNGINAGSLTFGPTGIVASFLAVNAGASYNWGAPVNSAMGFSTNTANANAPAVAMICSPATQAGVTLTYTKSTDVLVTSSATSITSAAALANRVFSQYHEDCAPLTGQTATFDALGNVTFMVSQGVGVAPAPVVVSAAQFNAALAGTPVALQPGGFTTFTAYSYKNALGVPQYVLVEHGSPAATGLVQGYVSVWQQ